MYEKYSDIKKEFKDFVDSIFGNGHISQNTSDWLKNELDPYNYGPVSRMLSEIDDMQGRIEDNSEGSIAEIKVALSARKDLENEKEFWGINDFRFYQDPDDSEILVLTNEEAEYIDRYPRHFGEILSLEGIRKITQSEFNFYLTCTKKRYTNLEDLKHDYFALKLAKLEA